MPRLIDGPAVTSRMFNGLGDFMQTRGLSFAEQAARVGLDPDATKDENIFVDFASVLQLFENAANDCGDDAFGLHFAEFCPLCPIGLYHAVLSNAPTLRDAMLVRVKYARLVVNAYDLSFTEANGIGCYRWLDLELYGPRRQFLDYVVTLLVERVRVLLKDPSWQPLGVEFQHMAPRDLPAFYRAFGSRVTFDAQRTCVLFDPRSLDRPIPGASTELLHALHSTADKAPSSPERPDSLTRKVQREFVYCYAGDRATEVSIAAKLGVSVRTLQRGLANEETTFEELRDATRKRATELYLVDTNLPLTDIAFLIGFSELSAFSRAARAWFGMPASAVRKSARTKQSLSQRPTAIGA